MGSSQIINYSLQPKATEIPTEPSFASHNSRITVCVCVGGAFLNWFVCWISSFDHKSVEEEN